MDTKVGKNDTILRFKRLQDQYKVNVPEYSFSATIAFWLFVFFNAFGCTVHVKDQRVLEFDLFANI